MNPQCIVGWLRTERYFGCKILKKMLSWDFDKSLLELWVHFHNIRHFTICFDWNSQVSRLFQEEHLYFSPRCKRDTSDSAVMAHWWEHSVRVCLAVGKDLWDSLSWRWNLPQRGWFGSKIEKFFTTPLLAFYFLLRI